MIFIYDGSMRRLPPLGTLRAFEAAARHLSFKAAADELGLTPPAISHQVRLLEAYCETRLFRRRPRPLALTEAGTRLFPILRSGFDSFASALVELGAGMRPTPLRVTTTSAFASRWLVPRLSSWRAAHPDVTLSIIGVDRLLNVDAGEVDFAIRYGRFAPQGGAREIFRDRFYPVCSPSLLAGAPPIGSAADLQGYPLIHYDWFSNEPAAPTWQRWFELAAATDPGLRNAGSIALSFREELHAIEAVLAGQGIAVCSDVVVADDIASGKLVKAFDLALPGFAFYLVHTPDHPRRDVIATFADWMFSVANPHR